jgi:DNA polymerase III alpha subunit
LKKLVKTTELFECKVEYLKPLFESCEFPWEILPKIKEYIKGLIASGLQGFTEIKDGEKVSMGGIISEVKRLSTKKGATMAFTKVEDVYGSIEVIIFPNAFDKCRAVLNTEETVVVTGRLQLKDGVPQIIAEDVKSLSMEEEIKELKDVEMLGIIMPEDCPFTTDDIMDVLESYPGDIRAIIAKDGKKYDTKTGVRKCDGLKSELINMVGEKG